MKNLFRFDLSHFRGDILGGVTAGIVALPLALAFGLQSGLGAISGLYGAIFIGIFAAFFGGTNTQISGPTAPMTAVSMIIIAGIVQANQGDLEKAVPSILIVFLLAGLFQVLLGVMGIGKYIRFIPYPVVSGFMTGIGVIILFTQIFPMLGYYPKEDPAFVAEFRSDAQELILKRIYLEETTENILVLDDYKETVRRAEQILEEDVTRESVALVGKSTSGVIGSLRHVGRAIQQISWADLIIGLLTIFIIYGFKRITTVVPSTLVALVAVSLGAFLLLPEYRTIGEIPSGFPMPYLEIFANFKLTQIMPHIVSAASLAALGAIDSLLTSIVADNMTKTKHNPKQELIGQGIGNSMAAMFGGIPGAGATIRTVVNIKAGGKTRISGIVAGLLLLVVLLSLGPMASLIPAAVLAGILVTVGIGVMDYRGLKHIRVLPKTEVVVMLTVLILTVFVGLIEAVSIGMVLASLIFMKNISDVVEHRTHNSPLTNFAHEVPWSDEGNTIDKMGDKIYIKHLDGPLFFGFASRFQDLMKALPSVRVVIMRMGKVPYCDQSGLYAMEEAVIELQTNGVAVAFVGLRGQPKDMFESINLVPGLVPKEYCFETFRDCLIWLKDVLSTERPLADYHNKSGTQALTDLREM